MDFAAQLAKLERNASTARNSQNNNSNNNSNRNNSNNSSSSSNNNNHNSRNHETNASYYQNDSNYDSRRNRSNSSGGESHQHRNVRPRTENYDAAAGRVSGGGGANTGGGGGRYSQGGYRGGGGGRNGGGRFFHRGNDNPRGGFPGNHHNNRTTTNLHHSVGSPPDKDGMMMRSSPYRHGGLNHHHYHKPPPLDRLVGYGYNVAPFPHDLVLPSADVGGDHNNALVLPPRSIPHLCLLAITIDDLPYENIWKHWAANSSSNGGGCYVSLVCHAKYPEKISSDWLRQRLLLQPPIRGRGKNTLTDPVYHSRRPEWGSPEITRAMIDLVKEGMKIYQKNPPPSTSSGTAANKDGTKITTTEELSVEELAEADLRFSTRRYVMARPHDRNGVSQEAGKEDVGSVSHDNAYYYVPPVDKFIFISETCIPVQSLDECCRSLFPIRTTTEKKEGDKEMELPDGGQSGKSSIERSSTTTTTFDNVTSWVNAFHRTHPGIPKNKYESDQFAEIDRTIPGQFRWKADQWLVLSRLHANAIINIDVRVKPHRQLWHYFARINASDEMYFPTTMALLGILEDDNNNKSMKQQHSTTAVAAANTATITSPSTTEDSQTTELPKTAVASASESTTTNTTITSVKVLRRPVTYTDWSEGMRNPTSYTGGIRDFIKVAKLARQKGCVVARKFALWPLSSDPTANKKTQNDDAPGIITSEQWQEAIEKLVEEVPISF